MKLHDPAASARARAPKTTRNRKAHTMPAPKPRDFRKTPANPLQLRAMFPDEEAAQEAQGMSETAPSVAELLAWFEENLHRIEFVYDGEAELLGEDEDGELCAPDQGTHVWYAYDPAKPAHVAAARLSQSTLRMTSICRLEAQA